MSVQCHGLCLLSRNNNLNLSKHILLFYFSSSSHSGVFWTNSKLFIFVDIWFRPSIFSVNFSVVLAANRILLLDLFGYVSRNNNIKCYNATNYKQHYLFKLQ